MENEYVQVLHFKDKGVRILRLNFWLVSESLVENFQSVLKAKPIFRLNFRLRPATVLKSLWRRCFLVNFANKISDRTPLL